MPDELDALVAAPDHHKLLLENDQVRVLDTRIEPGETVPLHCHCWPAVYYVVSWSDFIRRDQNGQIQVDTRAAEIVMHPGSAVWGNPLEKHTLENVGSDTLHMISVELKQSP
jgi:quercetin dioxygenase-like cupin family protein